MMRCLWIVLVATSCVAGPKPTAAMEEGYARIAGLTAEAGKPAVIVALPEDEPATVRWTTSSRLVLDALLPALGTRSRLKVELEEHSTDIHRVDPYAFDSSLVDIWRGAWFVSRIATQRNDETGEEHLEAFLTDRQGNEKAFNVKDPILQAVVTAVVRCRALDAADSLPMHLDVEVSDGWIVKVIVGQGP